MKDKKKICIIVLIFAIMTSIALVENFKGLFVPLFKDNLGITDTGIGVINGLGTFAYLIFSFIGSILCQKYGQKRVFILGLMTMILSLVLLKFTGNKNTLYLSMFILNTSLALTSIAINTIVPLISIGFQAVLMNLTHLCYGLGASSAQVIGSRMLDNDITWRNIYFYSTIIFIILIIFLFKSDLPRADKVDNKDEKKKYTKNEMFIIICLIFALGFYVFSELETGSWFINYLRQNYGYSIKKSGNYMSIFFLMLTIGRLVGGFVVEKIGYLKSIIIYMLCAIGLYFVGIIIGDKLLILVSISGFFYSIVYPTVIVVISNLFKEKSSAVIGLVITASSGVKMILSFGFGKLNDIIGSYNAFYFIPIALIISVSFIIIVSLRTSYSIREN
ncbi:MFS transporter [Oceanirhabdus sp. W0125-5]|uniref:MFS transporter n=1 Tax=Oceanirhabdus sp. W0125-5 TaxID=2999116 RepID=UPI0022F2BC82|nr:MFS transporter [Oceanirhabdus sp. W0125-5]WBW97543.1 MFS transporter [Oceanirhabdus sp. W0125-5]